MSTILRRSKARSRGGADTRRDAMSRLRLAIRQAMGVQARRRDRVRRDALRRAGRDPRAVWEVITDMLLRFGGASSGNAITFFCNGDEIFDAIWQAIDGAKRRVWYEMYTIEPDRVGRRTMEALTAAAQRGCQVRLLYDAVGSPRLGENLLKPLRDAGAQIDCFNPILQWKRPQSLLTRDHRKIIIIDNHTAFVGGCNTSEDYCGPRYGNGLFQDCEVRLEGPCVRDLADLVLGSMRLVRQVEKRDTLPRCGRKGETFVQALGSHGVHGKRAIQRAVRLTVRHAVQRCWITTPYFLPPRRLMRAMIRSAERGVDVRLLTAGVSDVPIARAAAQHIYGQFLRHGVRIFEMFDVTLHAKTMVIDGLYSTVGSFNLDQFSDKRNLEVNVGMIDPEVARTLEEDFERNLSQAREVTLDNWSRRTRWQRCVHWLAYQLTRL